MKEILKYSNDAFYTDVFSFSVALSGLIISIWKRKVNAKLGPMFFLFLVYLLVTFTNQVIIEGTSLYYRYKYIEYYNDFLDTIVEFLAFFFLIKNHLADNNIKKALNPLLTGFISLVIIYFAYYRINHGKIGQHFMQTVFTIPVLFLAASCSAYYIDIFRRTRDRNLAEQPSFWVVTGLAFFMINTLPFSIAGQYLVKASHYLYDKLFSIFDIFYCLLFLTVIKAYLCKPVRS